MRIQNKLQFFIYLHTLVDSSIFMSYPKRLYVRTYQETYITVIYFVVYSPMKINREQSRGVVNMCNNNKKYIDARLLFGIPSIRQIDYWLSINYNFFQLTQQQNMYS